ncbi:MAG TPA: hypothetical protein VIT92_09850, partial [Burkholderiaceae bacterium]
MHPSYSTVASLPQRWLLCAALLCAFAAGGQRLAMAAPGESLRTQVAQINRELESGGATGATALLTRRAALLADLAQQNSPDLAALGLSLGLRGALERDGSRLLETPVETSGKVEIQAIEREAGSGISYFLRDESGRLELNIKGRKPAQGQQIAIAGLRIGDVVHVSTWSAVQSNRSAQAAAPQRGSIGEQRIAVLMIAFPGMPLHAKLTAQNLTDTYFGATGSVDAFLRVSSAGKTWATGKVYGPYTVDRSYAGENLAVADAAMRAASGVDFTQYDHIVFITPVTRSVEFDAIRGISTMGKVSVALPGQKKTIASTAWLGDLYVLDAGERTHVAMHELGHGLGLGHADALVFGPDPLGPIGMGGAWASYRDYHSVMGGARLARPLGAPHAARLGWLAEGAGLKTVEADGAYTLRPWVMTEQPGVAALKVKRGSGPDAPYLWIEYRQAVAGTIEDELPAWQVNIREPVPRIGALVHYETDPNDLHTNLLRFNFSSEDTYKIGFADAPIAAGQTWHDPYSNLTLVVGQPNAQGLPVAVQYRATAGTVLEPAATDVPAIGGRVAIKVAVPAGGVWTAQTSAAWLQVTGPADGRGAGALSVAAEANPSTSARWASVTVNNVATVVTQAGAASIIALDADGATFSAAGGAGSIAISLTDQDHDWALQVSGSWIGNIQFSRFNFTGSGTLTYIVGANAGQARIGTIQIGDRTFTVKQMGGANAAQSYGVVNLPLRDAPPPRANMDMTPIGGG